MCSSSVCGARSAVVLLSGAHCRPLLPSPAEAASAALRGCSLGSPVKALHQQKQCELQKHTATESVQALTARGAVGRPWFRETPNGVDNSLKATRAASDAAADAARTTADAAAAAAAAVARRRRSSWLDRENVLKGFESPLPPAEFSEGNEPEPWVDTNWEDAADEYHQQAQAHQQKQHEQHRQGPAKESLGISAELPRRQQQDPHVNETSTSPIHGNSQGLYRKKDGEIITLWPSAADVSCYCCLCCCSYCSGLLFIADMALCWCCYNFLLLLVLVSLCSCSSWWSVTMCRALLALRHIPTTLHLHRRLLLLQLVCQLC